MQAGGELHIEPRAAPVLPRQREVRVVRPPTHAQATAPPEPVAPVPVAPVPAVPVAVVPPPRQAIEAPLGRAATPSPALPQGETDPTRTRGALGERIERMVAGARQLEVSPRHLAVLLVVAVVLAVLLRGAPVRQADELLQVVAALAAVAASVVAARRLDGRARWAWAAVAVGASLWCLGRLGWTFQGLPRRTSGSVANSADVGALASVLLFVVGVLLLMEVPNRRITQARAVIEGLMVAGCTLFVGWMTVFRATFDASAQASSVSRTLLVAQPLLQVVLIAALIVVTARIQPGRSRTWAPLAGGLAAVVIAEVASARAHPWDLLGGVRVDDLVRIAGFALIALAAARALQPPVPRERPAVVQRALAGIPSLTAVVVLVAAATRQAAAQPLEPALVSVALAVLALSVILHVVVLVESDALSAELSTAHDEAIQASITKSHFLATVSHEIRTPMNAVIGLTGLLLDSELDEEQRELAVGVAISADGLLSLINDLLDFSKVEAGKLELEEIDLDLEDLVGEVGMIVAESAHRKELEVIAYCEPGLPTQRRGDPLRLRQILLNLASNAVKFTERGSVVIKVGPGGDDPDRVSFEVTDTGVGIPETERARLFEPFSQLDGSTTRTFGGTGLGLAIVKRLTDIQGGVIEIESQVGRGTTFRVTMPLPVGMTPRVEAGLAGLVGLRALVVDGNAVTRTVLAHSLHTWGFVVDQAESAEDALERHGWSNQPDHRYALALVEHQLDGMDGLHLAEVLRAQEPTASTVILLLTSAHNVSRQAAHDAGIHSVLLKPVRTTYLLRRIVDSLVTDPPDVHADATTTKGHHP